MKNPVQQDIRASGLALTTTVRGEAEVLEKMVEFGSSTLKLALKVMD